jgi:hypothetical protein
LRESSGLTAAVGGRVRPCGPPALQRDPRGEPGAHGWCGCRIRGGRSTSRAPPRRRRRSWTGTCWRSLISARCRLAASERRGDADPPGGAQTCQLGAQLPGGGGDQVTELVAGLGTGPEGGRRRHAGRTGRSLHRHDQGQAPIKPRPSRRGGRSGPAVSPAWRFPIKARARARPDTSRATPGTGGRTGQPHQASSGPAGDTSGISIPLNPPDPHHLEVIPHDPGIDHLLAGITQLPAHDQIRRKPAFQPL